jgi:hypothetical protein
MVYVIDPIRAYLFPQIALIYADSAGNIVFSIQLLTTHYSLLTTHKKTGALFSEHSRCRVIRILLPVGFYQFEYFGFRAADAQEVYTCFEFIKAICL